MRILVVTTWFPGLHNPAEAPFVVDHVRALQSLGHRVRVVHVQLGSRLKPHLRPAVAGAQWDVWEGIEVLRTVMSPRHPARLRTGLATIRRQLRFADVLHTMAFSSILAALVPWIMHRPGRAVPWVHTEHWTGALDPSSVSRLWERLAWMRHLYVLPHQVTGVGGALATAMAPFARRDAVSVVPNVIRVPASVQTAAFGEPLRLVSVGALIGRKRPLAVVDTVRWLHDQGQDIELTWVGDGPLLAECEGRVRDAGLQGSVTFVGSVAPEEVAPFLGRADLFLLPSDHETFFASAAEAIGAGRAVVISRLDGLGDFLHEGNSVLVDGANPEELGAAVLEARARFRSVPADTIAAPIRAAYSFEAVGKLFRTVYSAAGARARSASCADPRATGGIDRADIMDE